MPESEYGVSMPRRVIRQIGRWKVPVGPSDTDRQMKEYDEKCGPVTVRYARDNGDNGDGRAEK
jgi:hypothetical protein